MSASALERLSEASGREFTNLLTARRLTQEGLAERRRALSLLAIDSDVAVVLMGSWGRAEVTSESDDDFMVLVRGGERSDLSPSVDEVRAVLDEPPGDQGIFGAPVASTQLVEQIGLEEDSNSNHSRRMLLLLESVPVVGEAVHADVLSELVARYLDASVKTTQSYLHADLAIKEKALARTKPLDAKPGRYRPTDETLAFLEGL
jgi:UTP:GlnB (protein PII) uridylyltransferase